ncbi:MAG: type I-U CRISPR-associated protein Cas5/Cas6 [Alphaproteobacteria bacterium]|nr:type I-U CRISPR-associated protein Cas5/Cas6 [Alphaproteobacteria bacterium]
MIALEVSFLTGRCVATRYHDRDRAEWPPHPARVFSALVATHTEDPDAVEAERAALAWLERQPPPAICATEASERGARPVTLPALDPQADAQHQGTTVFVPVNDTTVVRDNPRQAARRVPAPSAGDVRAALQVTPERRVRQPRSFPSVTPHDPVVHLVWPEAPPPPVRAALDALARRVVRVGHSASLVRCRWVDEAPEPTWVPDPAGETLLRCVTEGQLDWLEQEFQAAPFAEGRVLPFRPQRYRRAGSVSDRWIPASLFDPQWVVLRRRAGPRLPSTWAVTLATAVRDALMEHGDQPPPALISGHAPGGGPSPEPHLAVLPLPFVGRKHADGRVLGVALALPRGADPRPLHRALGGWQRDGFEVRLGRPGVLKLELVEDWAGWNLAAPAWCRPARRWVTATPIALDRNPGDLHARDPDRAAAACAEAQRLIANACTHIGLPCPARVVLHFSASLVGGARARAFPPYPRQQDRLQRVKVHAELVFDAPVRGPVVLGAGRFLGLGLCRPMEDDDAQG